MKCITAFVPEHRATLQHSARGHPTEKSVSEKKLKTLKNVALNRPERVLVYRMRAEPRDAGHAFADSSGSRGQALTVFTTLHVCVPVNDYRRTISIDFGVTNNFFFNCY